MVGAIKLHREIGCLFTKMCFLKWHELMVYIEIQIINQLFSFDNYDGSWLVDSQTIV